MTAVIAINDSQHRRELARRYIVKHADAAAVAVWRRPVGKTWKRLTESGISKLMVSGRSPRSM
jgi:hypothetical protein